MAELKPCPFCGGDAGIIFLAEYRAKPYIEEVNAYDYYIHSTT